MLGSHEFPFQNVAANALLALHRYDIIRHDASADVGATCLSSLDPQGHGRPAGQIRT